MKRSDLSIGQHVAVRTNSKNDAYMTADREALWTSEGIVLALDVSKRPGWSYSYGSNDKTYKVNGKTYKVPARDVPSNHPGKMVLVVYKGYSKKFDSFDIVRLMDLKGEWATWHATNKAEVKQQEEWRAEAERDKAAQAARKDALEQRLAAIGIDTGWSRYDSDISLSLDDVETLLTKIGA